MRFLCPSAAIASCLVLLVGLPLRSQPEPTPAVIEAGRQFRAIEREWQKTNQEYQSTVQAAKTDAERRRLSAEKRPDPKPYAARFMKVAQTYPGTYAEAAALYWVINHAEKTDDAPVALRRLKEGPITKADLRLLWGLFFFGSGQEGTSIREVTPLVYERVAREPDHPKAPDLLIWVCQATANNDRSAEGAKLYNKAADLLISRHADAKYLWRFCPLLQRDSDPAWAEKHLRTVLTKNKVPAVKVAASFALASVLQNKSVDSQAEAERLYGLVIKEVAGAAKEWGTAERENSLRHRESFIEFDDADGWVQRAQHQLDEIKARGLGKPAPELAGEDLDGKPIRLSDHRGKVVLLSFWATWCPPCMALVPHERELTRLLDGKPFVLLGVNGDDDLPKARKVAAAKGITWRSFKDTRGEGDTISKAWNLAGWPTLYLIDHKGIIRKRWVGASPTDVLRREVENALAAVSKAEK